MEGFVIQAQKETAEGVEVVGSFISVTPQSTKMVDCGYEDVSETSANALFCLDSRAQSNLVWLCMTSYKGE